MSRKEAQPRQRASGKWAVVRTVTYADGTKKRVSYQGDTPKEAQYKALEDALRLRREAETAKDKTVREILEIYIDRHRVGMSPSTALGYRRMSENCFAEIRDVRYSRLSDVAISKALKVDMERLSAKSVRNAYGFLFTALKGHDSAFTTGVVLPKNERRVYPVITQEHIHKIIAEIAGSDIELPVLLSLMLGLRMSEVIGLRWEDVHDGYLVIQRAVVTGEEGPTEKGTKSSAGTRSIPTPKRIADLIAAAPQVGTRVVPLTANALHKRWRRWLPKHGLPQYRFHDLRAANASVMAALGVAEKYAMQRGGWATLSIMRNVYQHTFNEEELAIAAKMEAFFDDVQPELQPSAEKQR